MNILTKTDASLLQIPAFWVFKNLQTLFNQKIVMRTLMMPGGEVFLLVSSLNEYRSKNLVCSCSTIWR